MVITFYLINFLGEHLFLGDGGVGGGGYKKLFFQGRGLHKNVLNLMQFRLSLH